MVAASDCQSLLIELAITALLYSVSTHSVFEICTTYIITLPVI